MFNDTHTHFSYYVGFLCWSRSRLVKFIKLNDQNADIEELNSIADINGFIAIDTEYESQKDNGCVLIQIATIVNPNTENFITVTPYTYILEQPCLRSVIVYIFEVNEKYIHNSLLFE